ncbi:MAG: D-sedoheptulose-7-phosphate isomerase [Kiritimatiellia bacterium]|jgi:D-sedoheptulose 7-phosphate isomerase
MSSTSHPSSSDFKQFIDDAAAAIRSLHDVLPDIEAAVELIVTTLSSGGKVLTAGNGGSAAEAMHLAEELSGRYKHNRRALPGLALCADGTALTCIANDFGFDQVFARQIEAFGAPGDLLVLFSTSGNSPNLLEAARAAQSRQMKVLSLLGRGGGALRGKSDVDILVPDTAGAHVQEAHQVVLHLMLESIDAAFA